MKIDSDPVETFGALTELCKWIVRKDYHNEIMAYHIEHFYNQLGSGETPKMALALAKKCFGENSVELEFGKYEPCETSRCKDTKDMFNNN